MKIRNLTIDEWDGTDYVVLHQVTGFYFSERRFNQGILTDDFCLLFKKDGKLGNNDFDLIKKMCEAMKATADNSNFKTASPKLKHS